MDEFMKQALEIAKAQAGVRAMTPEQFIAYAKEIADGLRGVGSGEMPVNTEEDAISAEEAKKSIKERTVTCLVCGKSFKVLSKRHLESHGLTPKEYREKYGLKKGMPLVCKALVKQRRAKMNEMKIWQRVNRVG